MVFVDVLLKPRFDWVVGLAYIDVVFVAVDFDDVTAVFVGVQRRAGDDLKALGLKIADQFTGPG